MFAINKFKLQKLKANTTPRLSVEKYLLLILNESVDWRECFKKNFLNLLSVLFDQVQSNAINRIFFKSI